MSEIDRQFLALTNNLRFETDKLQEYEDVTTDLQKLQEDFVDHLVAFDGFNPDDEDAIAVTRFLHTQLTSSLESLSRVGIGDTITTSGQGIIMCMDKDGMLDIEYLADDVRLHGTLQCPYVIEIPLSLDTPTDDSVLSLPDTMALRPGVVVEILNATIETVDPDTPFTASEPVKNGLRVFLPIDYPDLRIKRQIPPR